MTYNRVVAPRSAIAVNASIVGERPTGLGHYSLQLISALDEFGERLIVYTSCPDLIAAPRATIHRVSARMRPERGASGHLQRLFWIQTGLRLRLQRDRPRVLLNLMPEGLLQSRLPQITVVHDLLPLRYPAEYPRQQYYFRHFIPAVLRVSRAVVVTSESTRRDLLAFYRGLSPASIHVIPCGYDARRFTAEAADRPLDGAPFALYVGNVLPHKNLLTLVEAFGMVARRHEGRLVIRGWGHPVHVQALRDRIESLGLAPRIDWQPYVSAQDLARLYRQARMLVLPSLYEGFGLTALESMACGTPVIASNVSSLPEVVGEAALLVEPTDVEAIAAAMTRLFNDDALVKELATRGPTQAARFSWQKAAGAVQALVGRVIP
ncbi:MAG: glycosyltransferase family 4 protein [Candidatus Rokuibacteriota bacterium]